MVTALTKESRLKERAEKIVKWYREVVAPEWKSPIDDIESAWSDGDYQYIIDEGRKDGAGRK